MALGRGGLPGDFAYGLGVGASLGRHTSRASKETTCQLAKDNSYLTKIDPDKHCGKKRGYGDPYVISQNLNVDNLYLKFIIQ